MSLDATYWKHTTYDGDCPPWELKEIPGKGYCTFATRKYFPGDLICCENVTVTVSGHSPFNKKQIDEIETNINQLPSDDREAFYAMANSVPDAPSLAAGIFITNSFDMTDCPDGPSCGMYVAIGR